MLTSRTAAWLKELHPFWAGLAGCFQRRYVYLFYVFCVLSLVETQYYLCYSNSLEKQQLQLNIFYNEKMPSYNYIVNDDEEVFMSGKQKSDELFSKVIV